jgi:hypothetical protein
LEAAAGGQSLELMQTNRRNSHNPDEVKTLEDIEEKRSPRAHEKEVLDHAQFNPEQKSRKRSSEVR